MVRPWLVRGASITPPPWRGTLPTVLLILFQSASRSSHAHLLVSLSLSRNTLSRDNKTMSGGLRKTWITPISRPSTVQATVSCTPRLTHLVSISGRFSLLLRRSLPIWFLATYGSVCTMNSVALDLTRRPFLRYRFFDRPRRVMRNPICHRSRMMMRLKFIPEERR